MEVGETRQPRHLLVEPRVVLHRARAKRVEAAVDRVILLRQAGVVTHHLRFAEPGQADRRLALEAAEAGLERRRVGQVDAAMAGRILLEDQLLLDLQAAIAADRRYGRRLARRGVRAQRLAPIAHRSTSRSPSASRSISSEVTVSVAATSSRSARSARAG